MDTYISTFIYAFGDTDHPTNCSPIKFTELCTNLDTYVSTIISPDVDTYVSAICSPDVDTYISAICSPNKYTDKPTNGSTIEYT